VRHGEIRRLAHAIRAGAVPLQTCLLPPSECGLQFPHLLVVRPRNRPFGCIDHLRRQVMCAWPQSRVSQLMLGRIRSSHNTSVLWMCTAAAACSTQATGSASWPSGEAVAGRLHRVPRFRQPFYIPPRRLGGPLWMDGERRRHHEGHAAAGSSLPSPTPCFRTAPFSPMFVINGSVV
jgi:hypothetical protein